MRAMTRTSALEVGPLKQLTIFETRVIEGLPRWPMPAVWVATYWHKACSKYTLCSASDPL